MTEIRKTTAKMNRNRFISCDSESDAWVSCDSEEDSLTVEDQIPYANWRIDRLLSEVQRQYFGDIEDDMIASPFSDATFCDDSVWSPRTFSESDDGDSAFSDYSKYNRIPRVISKKTDTDEEAYNDDVFYSIDYVEDEENKTPKDKSEETGKSSSSTEDISICSFKENVEHSNVPNITCENVDSSDQDNSLSESSSSCAPSNFPNHKSLQRTKPVQSSFSFQSKSPCSCTYGQRKNLLSLKLASQRSNIPPPKPPRSPGGSLLPPSQIKTNMHKPLSRQPSIYRACDCGNNNILVLDPRLTAFRYSGRRRKVGTSREANSKDNNSAENTNQSEQPSSDPIEEEGEENDAPQALIIQYGRFPRRGSSKKGSKCFTGMHVITEGETLISRASDECQKLSGFDPTDRRVGRTASYQAAVTQCALEPPLEGYLLSPEEGDDYAVSDVSEITSPATSDVTVICVNEKDNCEDTDPIKESSSRESLLKSDQSLTSPDSLDFDKTDVIFIEPEENTRDQVSVIHRKLQRRRKINNKGSLQNLNDISDKKENLKLELPSPIKEEDSFLKPPLSANIGRSASFNDQLLLDSDAQKKLEEVYNKNHSNKQSSLGAGHKSSSISQAFKRLMNSPAKKSGNSPSVESRPELIDSATSTTVQETTKRPNTIKQIGTSIAKKITRKTAGSSGTSTPSEERKSNTVGDELNGGLNDFQRAMVSATAASNGRVSGDPELVCYEQLLKLFLCPGCEDLMRPPYPQCRKGHLVCAKCKQQMKNVCPVCKQRFADTPNLMMEQVSGYNFQKLQCTSVTFHP